MADVANYQLQFFRQWLSDPEIGDLCVADSLDHAKTLARASLARLAADLIAKRRPQVGRIVDAEPRAVVVQFRLTHGGPVEIAGRRLRWADGATPTRRA